MTATGFSATQRFLRTEPRQDHYGRHLVPNADGNGATAFSRASTVAKTLSDGSGITNWKTRLVAYGVAARPDLIALASTAGIEDKRRMNEVVASAMETAQASSAANTGTSIHSATEQLDLGTPLDVIPSSVRENVAAYQTLIQSAGLVPVDIEVFVVNEEPRGGWHVRSAVSASGRPHDHRRPQDRIGGCAEVRVG